MELTRNDATVRSRELAEALEQQAATVEILRAISRAREDPQLVFDTIAQRAATLCGAKLGVVSSFDGKQIHLVACHGTTAEAERAIRAIYPLQPGRGTLTARIILGQASAQIPDTSADPDFLQKKAADQAGFRSNMGVPMLQAGRVIGSIVVAREKTGPFPDRQVELLKTFADQAVIAIENARLFKELETRNRELADALEQQAATNEILRVMSLSRTDTLPVFETIVRKAVALCGSLFANVFRFDGELLHYVASHNTGAGYVELLQSKYPMRPDRSQVSGRVILTRSVVRLGDARADPQYDQRFPDAMGWRRMLGVPMLLDGTALGVIVVGWAESGPVPKSQEELLQTFADQAVIAIENVRLFNELETRNRELTEALEQQTATGEILRVISQSPTDVQPVFDTIAAAAMKLCGATSANVFTFDGKLLHAAAIHVINPGGVEAVGRIFPRPPDRGTAASRAVLARTVVAIPDTSVDSDYALERAPEWGYRSALGIPLMREGVPIGAMALGRSEPGAFPEKLIALLKTFADQAVIAIENVRLFRELEDKSRQLELASRHKSAFLANMSHELRTPLNAIIGFTRIVMRQSRERLESRQYENLEKILASGQHLLSLINAILDLAKVEAGHIEITAEDVQLAPILEQCMRTVEPLVKDGVKLVKVFDDPLPKMFVDEEKLRQIVINLISNAAKFTESGTIEVRAREQQGSIEIAVVDTGIGIPADKLELIFEEFEQADASSTRQYGGTGLGLTIARRLARLMGGDIHAESEPGAGSSFALMLPVRYRSVRV